MVLLFYYDKISEIIVLEIKNPFFVSFMPLSSFITKSESIYFFALLIYFSSIGFENRFSNSAYLSPSLSLSLKKIYSSSVPPLESNIGGVFSKKSLNEFL